MLSASISRSIFPKVHSSKEILRDSTSPVLGTLLLTFHAVHIILRRRIKHIENPLPVLCDLKDTSHVTAPVTIIRCAPYCAQLVVVQHLETLLAQLMRPQYMVHVVDLEKLPHNLRSKGVACAARAQTELVTLGIWIAPDQICHRSFMRYFSEAVDDLDLVDGVYGRRQTAVYAEDLVADDDGEGEVVEHVGEVMPNGCGAILAAAFCVETIGLGDAARFVVAADEVDARWVAKFEAHEEGDCFDAEEATVYVIAYEPRVSIVAYARFCRRRGIFYLEINNWYLDRTRLS